MIYLNCQESLESLDGNLEELMKCVIQMLLMPFGILLFWPFDYLLPLIRGHSHGVFDLPRLFGIYNYVINTREVGRNTIFLLQCLTANNGGILK